MPGDGVDGVLGTVGLDDAGEGRPLHAAASAAKQTTAMGVCVRVMRNLPDWSRSKLHGSRGEL
jgi:hypothetical protein